ncbi:DUF4342 domain-containing protein [Desulfitibacter alkalitolerans]|uniref:DUF4342 domain-containing protein n=1 Tax=Desulfitibacter alkalitolerans TaxID=264641 RepID=UPI000481EAB6|nr:DUF4342 domain-containing protein [Desulfitibacter alkalitolerans]
MEKLDKVELVRDRTGASYEKARDYLEANGWDVVEAIVAIEKEKSTFETELNTIKVKGQDLLKKIKELIRQGNVAKIIVKKDGNKVISIPVNGGIILALFFPYFVALSAVIVLMAEYELEVEKIAKNNEADDDAV